MALGIGDAVCADSLLTQEERNKITEIFWACRFGPQLVPLFENNPFYPNLRAQHTISDEIGRAKMREIDSRAELHWHFRPDFPSSRQAGLELFNLSGDVNFIDGPGMFLSDRTFTNSSFIDQAKESEVNWEELGVEPEKYVLFHYPTSTRPRTDIATISDSDWSEVERISQEYEFPVIIVSDTDIQPPIHNFKILRNYPIRSILALCKFAAFYVGCDSWCAISCAKVLSPERLFVKSHNPDIQNLILGHKWLQKFFLPHSPQAISTFYKNYL